MKILIRTKNRHELLRQCVNRIKEVYPDYTSILIVDSSDAVLSTHFGDRTHHEVVDSRTSLYGSTIKLLSSLNAGDRAVFVDDDEIVEDNAFARATGLLDRGFPFAGNGRGFEYMTSFTRGEPTNYFSCFSFFAFKWHRSATILRCLNQVHSALKAMDLNLSQEDSITSLLLSYDSPHGGYADPTFTTAVEESRPKLYSPGWDLIDDIIAVKNIQPLNSLAHCWQSPVKFLKRRQLLLRAERGELGA